MLFELVDNSLCWKTQIIQLKAKIFGLQSIRYEYLFQFLVILFTFQISANDFNKIAKGIAGMGRLSTRCSGLKPIFCSPFGSLFGFVDSISFHNSDPCHPILFGKRCGEGVDWNISDVILHIFAQGCGCPFRLEIFVLSRKDMKNICFITQRYEKQHPF